jgi:type I restriction enzyme S subunit
MSSITRKRGWRDGKLEDLVFFQRGFDITQAQQREGSYPVISSSGVTSFHDEFKVSGPGVVIGRKGTIGSIHFTAADYWPHDTTLWSKDLKGNNPRFVYYFLHTLDFKRFDVGNSNPTLNRNHIHDLAVSIPPLSVQNDITDVLSAYDELMENNRRRMGLLEEAARLLYREWFVRLRFPGHEHARPSQDLPDGWERKTLIDVCSSLEDGDWLESKDQGGEDYRLLQISNIGMNDFIETGNYRFISEETFRRLNCREVKPGDILISRMPTPIGRAWLVTEMPWKMVTAVDAAILTTDDTVADRYFLLYHLNSPSSIEHCERRAVGATRPRVARRELAGTPVLLPPVSLQREFREIVEPISEQRANLYRQIQKLRTVRDLLLPPLMSGEIAV